MGIHTLDWDHARNGFVPMLTSCHPAHNATYIDEGNNEMFVVEQVDDEGHVDQLHLTPNQAFEMRDKLDRFLAKHFTPKERDPVPPPSFVIPARWVGQVARAS